MKVNVKADYAQTLVIWAFNMVFRGNGEMVSRVDAGMFAIEVANMIRLYDEGQLFVQVPRGSLHCFTTPQQAFDGYGPVYTLYSDKDGVWLREYNEENNKKWEEECNG